MAIMKFKNVVLKNLFSKTVTKNYPAEPAVYPERSRGHVEIDIDTCILCGICGMNSDKINFYVEPRGVFYGDKIDGYKSNAGFDATAMLLAGFDFKF